MRDLSLLSSGIIAHAAWAASKANAQPATNNSLV